MLNKYCLMILTDDKGGWKTLFIRDADVDVYSSMNLFYLMHGGRGKSSIQLFATHSDVLNWIY